MDHYFRQYVAGSGLPATEFLGLGRRNPLDDREDFCMTVLALRMAAFSNGVSRLHGEVSRGVWQSIWPGVPAEEVPIAHVTNGVHFRSWISLEMNQLYDRYLGPSWREQPVEKTSGSGWRRSRPRSSGERTSGGGSGWSPSLAGACASSWCAAAFPRSEVEGADEVLDPRRSRSASRGVLRPTSARR